MGVLMLHVLCANVGSMQCKNCVLCYTKGGEFEKPSLGLKNLVG